MTAREDALMAAIRTAHVAEWVVSRCETCGRDLLWLPGQMWHKCGWCGRTATWLGGTA